MKNLTHKNKWLFILSLMVLFASCKGIHYTEVEDEVVLSGKLVTLNIEVDKDILEKVNDEARTALNKIADRDSITNFILTEGDTELGRWSKDWDNNISAYKNMQINPVSVTEGVHTFTLTANNASQNKEDGVIYIGKLENVTVTQGTVLNFTLYFAGISEDGNGSCTVTVEWPYSTSSKYYKYSFYRTEDGITYNPDNYVYGLNSPSSMSTSSTPASGYFSCNASFSNRTPGRYILRFEVYSSINLTNNSYSSTSSVYVPVAYAEELVYVSANVVSTSTVRIDKVTPTYYISYRFNGGALNGSSKTSVGYPYSSIQDVVLYGSDGTNTITKANYVFGGWYFEQDFSGEEVKGWDKYTYAGDKTLYAKWNYGVTFNPNGSTEAPVEGETESVVALPGTELTLTKNAFTREGYLFNGWNTMADGSGTTYEDCSKFTADTNVTLYAQWIARAADKVAVSFRANGGTLEPIQEIESGSTITEPTSTLTGYELVGWYTSENFEDVTKVNFATYKPTEDVTLYAKWKPQEFTITYYDYKEGETAQAFSGTHQAGYPTKHIYDSVTQLEIPEKPDCSIAGWYTDADCSGTALTELFATGYLSNITLYAKWVRNVYYVSETGSDDAYIDNETAYGDGSSEHPYATLSPVLTDIIAVGEKVDNIIKISGNITGIITIDLAADKAKSITITGVTGNDTDSLDGNYQGTVLTISTAIPVTLKNITVTKGYSYSAGAAISLKAANTVLTLENGTLVKANRGSGRNNYNSNGILVDSGSTLIMEEGAEISENIRYSNGGDYGGGVSVYNGKFIMNGGSIINNPAYIGGGVFIYQTGTFEMNGGSITKNSANNGGGVYNMFGKFTMNDGEISENTASNSGAGVYTRKNNSDAAYVFIMNGGSISNNNGSGVYLTGESSNGNSNTIYTNDTFTMNGGSISDNNGSGVYSYSGTFTMNDGVISGNQTSNRGGGLYNAGKFTLNGGSITENTVTYTDQTSNEYGGGGVYNANNYNNSFVMNGGEISRNTAKYGGGIYNASNYTITSQMNGGVIQDNTAEYGGAIYLNNGFSMGGRAYIPAGEDGKHDIYFASSGRYIGVSKALTSTAPVAKVTLSPAALGASQWGTSIISPASGISVADKFELTPYEDEPWFINNEGKLDAPQYTIIYKDKGNNDFTADNLSSLPAKHQYGAVTTLVKPTREGYEFIGWYKDSDCFESMVTSIAPKELTEAITLYAKWARKSVNIQITNSDISIKKTVDSEAGTITLTAANGFSDYLWFIGNTPAQNVITGSSVSEDGKTFTFSTDNLAQGRTYLIVVSALRGSTEYTSTIQIKK